MRSVVVTGVSRGLGAALFSRLVAERNTRVRALGRRFSAAQHSVAADEPDRVRLTPVDLAALDDGALLALRDACAEAMVAATDAVLLLNAGVVEPIGAVGTLPAADVAAAVAVNLTAPMLIADAFLAARPPGLPATILFISSGAATRPVRGWAPYCATKAGGEMFFQVVAAEHPDVRVRNVNPGRMDTGMQAALRQADFPDVGVYLDAHERGELPDPAVVAQRIIAEHVTDR